MRTAILTLLLVCFHAHAAAPYMPGSAPVKLYYDMDFYPVSLSVVKNFLLVGDVYRSVQLLRWREDKKNLDLVALDDNDLPVFSSEFVADEKTLAFIVAARGCNLVCGVGGCSACAVARRRVQRMVQVKGI